MARPAAPAASRTRASDAEKTSALFCIVFAYISDTIRPSPASPATVSAFGPSAAT